MALIQASFISLCLKRNVRFNAFLPVDTRPGGEPVKMPLKTLYMLHGYMGSCMDWLRSSELGMLSEQHGLAIIMPDGENHHYVDDTIRMDMYGEFIGKEIVEFTRNMFPLSPKREDTFIGGISMGGYGAIRNGMKYHDVFSRVIAISPALITNTVKDSTDEPNLVGVTRGFYRSIFNDLDKVEESDQSPFYLARQLKTEGAEFPEIYQCCGKNDMLIHENRRFSALLDEIGVEHVFEEGAGTHDEAFFYPHMRAALNWLPLDRPPVPKNPFWIDD